MYFCCLIIDKKIAQPDKTMEQNSKSNDLNNNKPLNKHIIAPIELNLLSKLLEVEGIWHPYFDEVYPKLDALDNVTDNTYITHKI